MCLVRNAEKTKKLKAKLDKKKWITCYKVVKVDSFNKQIRSQFFSAKKWKVGENKSNSNAKYRESYDDINRGIHVYLTKKIAEKAMSYTHLGYIMPVKCHVDDFLGCNYWEEEAVFKKVTLSKLSYNRVLKEYECNK